MGRDIEGEKMKMISGEIDELQRLHHGIKQERMIKSRDAKQ